MDEFLTDQQQAERVRGWLRAYAPAAIAALAVGIGGYFGFAEWQARGDRQAAEASDLFEELMDELASNNRESAEELHGRLVAEFAGSGYADHARLMMAREYVDTTRPSLAVEELSELLAGASDSDLRQLTRLRLARVHLYMEQPQEGLAVLDADAPSPEWEQLTEDTRGDLYRALGRFEEAGAAYRSALDRTGQVDAGWIRMKLDYVVGMQAQASQASADDATAQESEDVQGPEAQASPQDQQAGAEDPE